MADKQDKIDKYSDVSKEKNGKWQHLVEYCLDLFKEYEGSEYRKKKLAEIKESHEAYQQIEKQTSDPWPGASNIILPMTTISADNLEPRLTAGLIGKQPYIEFELENEQERDPDTDLLQTHFNQELQDVVKIEDVANSIVHQMLLEGTVYPVAEYDLDEEMIRDFVFNPDTGDVILNQETQEPVTEDNLVRIFEGGKVEFVPFKDVFIADNVDDWEKEPVIRKVYPTYAELMRAQDEKTGYMNIGTWLLKEEKERKLSDDQQSEAQSLESARVISKEVIECIECSIRYIYQDEEDEKEDIKDFTEERLIAQIALDKKILIRLIHLRQINFKNQHLIKRIRLFPEKGLSYGTSVFGKMKSIQKGASKTFNMALNIAEVVMIPWFLFTQKLGLKKEETKLIPGKGIPVDDVTGIFFPTFNINPSQMFQYLSVWEGFWEKLLSIGNLQVGLPADKKQTATETMAVIEEGNTKHNYQAKKPREEFLSLLVTLYDLYYQNMPLDKTFLYNGDQVPIPRAKMRRPYNFRLTGSTEMSNKLIERKQNEDLYNLSLNDPKDLFNPMKIREDLLKSWGKTDTKTYLDPTIAQIINQIKQIPDAAEIFQEAIQQAQELAQQLTEAEQAPVVQ